MMLDESPYIMGLSRRMISCMDTAASCADDWNAIILCLDLETTGLSVIEDEILEISIIDVHSNQPVLSTKIRPEWAISWDDAQRIHGIRPADVVNAPFFREISEQVGRLLNAADIIVGYNVISYDLAMLLSHGVALGPHPRICDVMLEYTEIAAAKDGRDKWRSLVECCNNYGIGNTNAHSSISDCTRTSRAMFRVARDQRLKAGYDN